VPAPCDLCDIKIKTRIYHEDDVCIIVECADCRVPMMVLRRHAQPPTPMEDKHMRDVVRRLGFRITRERPRKIREHAHWHLEHR